MKHIRTNCFYENHTCRRLLDAVNFLKLLESCRSIKLCYSVHCLEWLMFLTILGVMLAFIFTMLAAYYGYDFVMLFIGVLLLITGVLLEIRSD